MRMGSSIPVPGERDGRSVLRAARPNCGEFARDSLLEGGGFEPWVPGAKEPVSFAEGELRGIERRRPTKVVSLRGTDGSNPSPSTSESCANLIARRARAHDRHEPYGLVKTDAAVVRHKS